MYYIFIFGSDDESSLSIHRSDWSVFESKGKRLKKSKKRGRESDIDIESRDRELKQIFVLFLPYREIERPVYTHTHKHWLQHTHNQNTNIFEKTKNKRKKKLDEN